MKTITRISSILFLPILVLTGMLLSKPGQGQTTFNSGAYIIDMGQSTQTINNGVKPYGLVYELIVIKGVPVEWAINPNKAKDGIDFTVGGKNYRGGPFIISAERITADVIATLNDWEAKGVVVDGPITNSFVAPVYHLLTSWPRGVLDEDYDQEIVPYYDFAEIPNDSYLTQGTPTMLNNCGDIYILPHADPEDWPVANINALKDYINAGGYLWASCRSVSILERISGCNFLSSGGLVSWEDHYQNWYTAQGSPPFTYSPATDAHPIMQFMGTLDNATQNGYEQIYLPLTTWRSTTKIAVYDSPFTNTIPNPDVTYTYPTNPAAVVAFGRAFGDPAKGMVMYEGGHTYDDDNWLSSGSIQEQVAAIRAFFNFILLAGVEKQISVTFDLPTFPEYLTPGQTYSLSATTIGTPPYSYEWSSTGGGSFSDPSLNPTQFTAPSSIGNIVIKLKVTDECDRVNFASIVMNQGTQVQCVDDVTTPTPPSGLLNLCGNQITFTPTIPPYTDTPNPITCEGTRVYTWTYTDYTACPAVGPFTRTWKYKYVIKHTTPPSELGGPVATSANAGCLSAAGTPGTLPVMQDVCGNVIPAPVPIQGGNTTNCGGTKTYTYNYSDCAGLITPWTFTYYINDQTAPSGTPPSGLNNINSCYIDAVTPPAGTPAFDANLAASGYSDNCSGNTVSCTLTSTAVSGDNCDWVVSYTFSVEDNCGNELTGQIMQFSGGDITNPIWNTAPTDLTVECDGAGNTTDITTWLAAHGNGSASDICSSVTYSNNYTGLSDLCGATGAAIVTFTATDNCGRTKTAQATITVRDLTNPTWNTAPTDLTVECDGAGNTNDITTWLAAHGNGSASDICGSVTYSNNYTGLSDLCGATGAAIVTFTATDNCGRTKTAQATITVKDLTNPTWNTAPTDLTVECDGAGNTTDITTWLAAQGNGSASDICSSVTYSNNYTGLSDLCGATGAAIVTFTATDNCGRTKTAQATITVQDLTNPTWNTAPTDLTVECDGAGNTTDITTWLAAHGNGSASDICGSVTYSNNYTGLSDLCGATGAAIVTFTATDNCGRTKTAQATITVQDLTNPTWNTAPTDLTVECDGAGNTNDITTWLAAHGNGSASDICGSVTYSNNYTGLSDLCGATGAAIVTFTATDNCGRTKTAQATITVRDLTNPTWNTAPTDLTVECDGAGNTNDISTWLAAHGNGSASDICSSVTYSSNYTGLSDLCGATGAAIVTFTATDNCGRTKTAQATITVQDLTNPTWNTAPTDLTVECDGAGNTNDITTWLAAHGNGSASDICGSVTYSNNYTGLSDLCGATGAAIVTFTATNNCGRTKTAQATITVQDLTNPTWNTAPTDLTVECDGAGNTNDITTWLAAHGNGSASDICGSVTYSNNYTGLSDLCGATGAAIVTFTATDNCGRTKTAQATITVRDLTNPTWNTAPTDLTVECDGAGNTNDITTWLAAHGNGSASDICGSVTYSNNYTGLSDLCGATGAAIVTFTATDNCGRTKTAQATITVRDLTNPTWNTAPTDLTVECDGAGNTNDITTWLAAHGNGSASDICGSVTYSNNYTGLSNLCGATGAAIVTFTATDNCGRTKTAQATVTVRDLTNPTWNTAPTDLTVECDGAGNTNDITTWLAAHGNGSASDICGSVTYSNNYTGLSDLCGATGAAIVTFTATDNCGRTKTAQATVTVRDLTNPTWNTAPTDLTVECDGAGNTNDITTWLAAHGNGSASDICGSVTYSNNYTGLSDLCGATGAAIVTFTATDNCGRTKTAQATITVRDLTNPTWNTVPTDLTVECDGAGNTNDITTWLAAHGNGSASDICGSVTYSNNYTGLSDLCGATGAAIVTFTATDNCGRTKTAQATVTVRDLTNPTWNTAPTDLTVECDGAGNTNDITTWLAAHGNGSASDICGSVTYSNNYTGLSDLCGATGAAIVTFTATDNCGRTKTAQATITVRDLTNPTWNTVPTDLTVECDGAGNTNDITTWLAAHGNGSASDICGSVTYSNNYTGLSDLCGATGAAIVIFTATDNCGRTKTAQATITVKDLTNPTWNTAPTDLTVECDGAGNTTDITTWLNSFSGDDDCGNAAVTDNFEVLSDDCGATGSVIVTFTLTDDCGNDITKEATFTIEDTFDPYWVIAPADKTVECDGNGNTTELNTWLNSFSGADDCGNASVTPYFDGYTVGCGGNVGGGAANLIITGNKEVLEPTPIGNTGAVTYTFILTDECGNSISQNATFTIQDVTDPEWLIAPSDLTVECDGLGNEADLSEWLNSFSGDDACGNAAVTDNFEVLSDDCGATGSVIVTFTLTDNCGNDITKDATFTIEDTFDPYWVVEPSDKTVECDGLGNASDITTWLNSFSGDDDCGNAAVTDNFEVLSDDCGATGSVIVTFTLTDDCGNDITKDATFTIEDTFDPYWVIAPADKTVECDGNGNTTELNTWLNSFSGADDCGNASVTPYFDGYTVGCGGNVGGGAANLIITGNKEVLEPTPIGNTGAVTYTFILTDECGNSISQNATFTIQDVTDPEWLIAPSDLTVECDGLGNEADLSEWLNSFSGDDACGNAAVTDNFEVLSDDCGATGSVIVTFTLTDNCGNDITKDATFTIEDTFDPYWVVEPSDKTVECDGLGNASDITTWLNSFSGDDDCGNAAVTDNFEVLSNDCGATGSVIVTFTLTDDCGNDITKEATFTIEDTFDPYWVVAPDDKTVECDGQGNTNEFAEWLESFSGNDACGEAAVTYELEGFTPGCDPTVGPGIYAPVNGDKFTPQFITQIGIGSRLVTFILTDDCGNDISQTATFTIEDTSDPDWVDAPADKTVECDGLGNETEFFEWLDSFSGSDACGNAMVTHNYYFGDSGATLSDLCGATGAITVTFNLTDDCDNYITKDATFTIEDTFDPYWVIAPADKTVECDGNGNTSELNIWLNSFSGADDCGNAAVTDNFEVLSNDCGATGSVIVTFTLTDDCGNDITKDATFTIEDTFDPYWVIAPADKTVECDGNGNTTELNTWLNSFSGADDCGNASVTPYFDGYTVGCGGNDGGGAANLIITGNKEVLEPTPIGNTGAVTYTFILTDECGNSISQNATFTIQDVTDPEWLIAPSDLTVECDGLGNEADLSEWLNSFSGDDDCGNAAVTDNFEVLSDGCGATGSVIVTFTLTDDCGNDITSLASFTMVDTKAPNLECPAVQTVEANSNCGSQVPDYTTNLEYGDDCTPLALLLVSQVPAAGTIVGVGNTIVTITVSDACGNSTSCVTDFTVTPCQPAIDLVKTGTLDMSIVAPADVANVGDKITYNFVVTNVGTTNLSNIVITDILVNPTGTPFSLLPGATAVGNYTATHYLTEADILTGQFTNLATVSGTAPNDAVVSDSDNDVQIFPNNPPVAMVDYFSPPMGVQVISTVATNDSDPNNNLNVNGFTKITDPAHGTLTFNANGSFTYTPQAFYIGLDQFIYQVCDLGNPPLCDTAIVKFNMSFIPTSVNNPPEAVINYNLTTLNNPVNGNVALNDSDVDDNLDLLSFVVTTSPLNGSVVMNANGTYTYTPNPGFTGLDTFIYEVCDLGDPIYCDTAIVKIYTITGPGNITLYSSVGQCSFVVNNISPSVFIGTVTYLIEGATTGSGFGSVSGFTFNRGVTTVKYTLTDPQGNTVNLVFTITISDNISPVIVCPPTQFFIIPEGSCSAVVNNLQPVLSDNCPPPITLEYIISGAQSTYGIGDVNGLVFPVGTSIITYIATDAAGNSSSCNFTVYVLDIEYPEIECPSNIVVNSEPGECGAHILNIAPLYTYDNCGYNYLIEGKLRGATILTFQGDVSGSLFNPGVTTVTYYISDAFYNTDSCQFTVTVNDNQSPGITCSPPVVTTPDVGSCMASGVNLGFPAVNDNCGAANVSLTNNAPDEFPLGVTTVTWTATDAAGKTATCKQLVTVIDNQGPMINCPATLIGYTNQGQCSANNINLGSPVTSDNCSIAGLTNNAPLSFPIGVTTVTWTVYDISGFSASCEQVVTIIDNEVPMINCPVQVTVNANPGECFATGINLGTPSFSDNCPGAVISNNAPESYPVGITTVTWTAESGNGTFASCEQLVTVTDDQNPTINCPDDLIVEADDGQCYKTGIITGTPVTADNCAIALVLNDAPDTYPVGMTIITWQVTDINGNSASCQQLVTVVDPVPPVIVCPADVTVPASGNLCYAANIGIGYPQLSDNCSAVSVLNNAPLTYPLGNTYVTWTATDAWGNQSTCSQLINVIDTTMPGIIAPADVYSFTNEGCTAIGIGLGMPYTPDNCPLVIVSNDHPSTTYPLGITSVTWTATDGSGNVSTDIQLVFVADNIPPEITCPPTVFANTDNGLCYASNIGLGTPEASDNCGNVNLSNDAPMTFPVGTTTVTWIATDNSGNTAQCSQLIIVSDIQPPTVICPENITMTYATYIYIPYIQVEDNCGISSVMNSFTGTSDASGVYPVGQTVLTWIVTNIHGNSNSCSMLVTLTDCQPDADNDYVVVSALSPSNLNVLENDSACGQVVSCNAISILSGPMHGSAQVNTVNGGIIYTPINGYTGVDSLQYMVCCPAQGGTGYLCDYAWVYITSTTPPASCITGSTTICHGGNATLIVSLSGLPPYTLILSDGDNLTTFSGITNSLFPIVVNPLITTTYTITSVQDATGLVINGNCTATVTVNILQNFIVTGGGNYCPGEPGSIVGLSGSTAGVWYQLLLNNAAFGAPLYGTGLPLSFGLQTYEGIYTVIATNASCMKIMAGVAIINIFESPQVFQVSGGGTCCHCCTDLHCYLSGSEQGVYYKLWLNSSTFLFGLWGTGEPLDFGYVSTTGTYTVTAINAYGCEIPMAGLANALFYPRAIAELVTPNTSIYAGSSITLTIELQSGTPPWNLHLFDGVSTTNYDNIMSSPFMISVSPAQTTTYTIPFVSDQHGCFNEGTGTTVITVNPYIPNSISVEGRLTYNNIGLTGMANTVINLVQNNQVHASATTDLAGDFQFPSIENGNYEVLPVITKPWGGVNSTDALLIMKHFTHMIPLNGLRLEAADVAFPGAVNSTDALYVMRRFTLLINSFPSGDWVFEKFNVAINNDQQSLNIKSNCFGDVNSSYIPLNTKVPSAVEITQSGIQYFDNPNEVIIPLRINAQMEVGAISLILGYQGQLIEIMDVTTSETNGKNLVFNVVEDEIRIAWYKTDGLPMNPLETVLNIKVRVLDVKKVGLVYFETRSGSEMSDANGLVSIVELTTPKLVYSFGNITASVFPNPFSHSTWFELSLPEESQVELRIFDMIGHEVSTRVPDQIMAAGKHSFEFNAINLPQGIYNYKLMVRTRQSETLRTGKLIIEK